VVVLAGLTMWDWLFQFLDPLETAGVPYAIVGSVAASVYGEPRATNDVDLVLQCGPADAARLARAFPADRFYVPPEEVIAVELTRPAGGHLNVIALESMTKADLYPLTPRDEAWFSRRRRLEVAGRPVWFAAPEAVILHKLRFFREGGGEKHLLDIRGILAVSSAELDRRALEEDVAGQGLTAEWLRASRP